MSNIVPWLAIGGLFVVTLITAYLLWWSQKLFKQERRQIKKLGDTVAEMADQPRRDAEWSAYSQRHQQSMDFRGEMSAAAGEALPPFLGGRQRHRPRTSTPPRGSRLPGFLMPQPESDEPLDVPSPAPLRRVK